MACSCDKFISLSIVFKVAGLYLVLKSVACPHFDVQDEVLDVPKGMEFSNHAAWISQSNTA